MAEFKVTFWGVRGSHPVPCREMLEFGGNTTCLQVTVGKAIVVVDAGTGIIEAGKKIAADYFKEPGKRALEITQLFTHLHHDHTQGLPFFTPLYIGRAIINFFGPKNFGCELECVLDRTMTPPNFPIGMHQAVSEKRITSIYDNHVILLDASNPEPQLKNRFLDKIEAKDSTVTVSLLNVYSHPANGVFVFKFVYGGKSVVFATDVEGYLFGDSRLVQFVKGADLLIHDAQYSKEQYTSLPTPRQGFGHSIPEMAIEVAKLAGVKSLALTHHDPMATDAELKKNEARYKRDFANLFYAREGHTYTVE